MNSIEAISPFRCRMWEFHDRLQAHVNEETCQAEICSFERHGQLIPVLGRPLRGDPTHDVELLYGARRLFVARHLNKPLNIELREMTDKEGIIAMDIENRHRKSVSPYEQGLAYTEWLRAKHFDSQDEIAKALRISPSQVSRLLKIARLPAVIINAFASPLEIREGWGLVISAALDEPRTRSALIESARNVASRVDRPHGTEVFRLLLAGAVPGRQLKKSCHDEVVKNDHGVSLFRIRHQRSMIAFLLPIENISTTVMNELKKVVTDILDRRHLTLCEGRVDDAVSLERSRALLEPSTAVP